MTKQNVSMIVAASENNVIGVEGGLPWHISSDLKRFRKLTTGHHIIMGRKTFESIGRLLPQRTTVIITRNSDYHFDGAKIAGSIRAALQVAEHDAVPFITGGAEIYKAAMDYIHTIHLTRVHTEIKGDTFLPEINFSQWKLESTQRHAADNKNEFDYSFETYLRVM